MFAVMSALVRYVGDATPVGQVVFFRSAFAIVPVVLIYAWRGELAAAVRTSRPFGHFGRGMISVGGMFLNFAALARLPIVDVTDDHVRVAADHGGAVGDLPQGARAHLSLDRGHRRLRRRAGDAVAASRSRALHRHGRPRRPRSVRCSRSAARSPMPASVVQTRRLTDTETTSSIVFYFSLFCAIGGLADLPFGWIVPTLAAARRAGRGSACSAASRTCCSPRAIATRRPRWSRRSTTRRCCGRSCSATGSSARCRPRRVYVGAAIVAGAGLFVIWRERQLGLERARRVRPRGPRTGIVATRTP